MARVVLASAFTRWLPSAGPGELALALPGDSLAQVLEALFARHPTLRGYVVDEAGRVRHHVAVFVDGESIRDKSALDLPLRADAEVYLLQALSGG